MSAKNQFEDNYSKGCQACQEGKWLCIYLTYYCNATCTFCPAPLKNKDVVRSAFGNNPNVILEYLKRYPFKGLSFTGGECFMVFDRMLQWLQLFKTNKPELYYWAYTNGIQMKSEQLIALKESGLSELRFNIAATGYNNPAIFKNIEMASKIFDFVAVEIPSIPEDFEKLVQVLPVLNDLGVTYLNLHEYILVPNDPNTQHAPMEQFIMNFDMDMKYHKFSLDNTGKIKSYCRDNKLGFKINSCSLNKKEHQMLGRRLTMGSLLKGEHEKLTPDGFLKTVYLSEEEVIDPIEELKNFQEIDKLCFVHPDDYRGESENAYLLTLLPKMGIKAMPKVHKVTKL